MNPTPSSWSLDSGKEAKNMADGGKLISPPVPPRPTQTGGYLKHLTVIFIKITFIDYSDLNSSER